jgi:hypothetical protein
VGGCRRIDVQVWQRGGFLRPGRWFSWAWWNRDGVRVASITVHVEHGRVLLWYRIRRQGKDWQDIKEPVSLVWTPCRCGGQPSWFICPGIVNGRVYGRRMAILYGGAHYFLRRHCYNLAYESPRENLPTRLISKAQKIRRRLGGRASSMEPFPSKPKGVHWRTYSRLYLKVRTAERVSIQAMVAQLKRTCGRSRIGAPQRGHFYKQMLIAMSCGWSTSGFSTVRRGGMPASHHEGLIPGDRDACALNIISRTSWLSTLWRSSPYRRWP